MIPLLVWAFAVVELRPAWPRPVLAGLLAVAGLGNDLYDRAHSGELFFTSSQTTWSGPFYRGALLRYGWKGREFFIEPFGASHWTVFTFFRQFLGD